MKNSGKLKFFKSASQKAKNEALNTTQTCMVPSCNKNSIKSHSLQKSILSKYVAENHMLRAIDKSLLFALPNSKDYFKLIPAKRASIFNGFCSSHDSEIFSDIENKSIDIDNSKDKYLLHLRCVCYEYCQKRFMHDYKRNFLSISSEYQEIDKSLITTVEREYQYFWNTDSPRALAHMFGGYNTKGWDSIVSEAFMIEHNIGVACVSTIPLGEETFQSRAEGKPLPYCSISVVPDASKTKICISTQKEYQNEFGIFINTIKPMDLVRLNHLIFAMTEDAYVRPSLWNKLTKGETARTYKAMMAKHRIAMGLEVPFIIQGS